MMRVVFVFALILNLLTAGCVSSYSEIYEGEDIYPNKSYNQFQLINSKNKSFNSSTLDGRVVVVNFFLTNCQDACPTITTDLKLLYDDFTSDLEENLSFISISVDPWRDGPNDLVDYMSFFNTSWTYLTTEDFIDGDFSLVEQIWTDFGIGVVLTESENSTSVSGRGHTVYYDVEHTNGIVIVGKDGLQKVRWDEDNWHLEGIKSDLEFILSE